MEAVLPNKKQRRLPLFLPWYIGPAGFHMNIIFWKK
jgi:hypothetical protein